MTAPPPPPDRAHLLTEQRNPRTMRLHAFTAEECIQAIQEEDRQVLEAVTAAREQIAGFVAGAEPGFCAGGRLIYLGAGTSGRLGVLDASEAPPTFQVEPGRVVGLIAGGDAALRRSSEGMEDDPQGAGAELRALSLSGRDSILGIAAGGTTPYVLGGLQLAKAEAPAAVTGLLVCTPIRRPSAVDHLIVAETGPEVLTGSTRMKAGTATKMILNTISTTLMVRSGRVYENLMVDLRARNEKLLDRAARIVATLTGCTREAALGLLAEAAGEVKTAVLMGRVGLRRMDAEALLARAGGRLGAILDDPDAASKTFGQWEPGPGDRK